MDTEVSRRNTNTKPPNKGGLDWDAIRQKYADRRRQEGATEEEIWREQNGDGRASREARKKEEKATRKSRAKPGALTPQECGKLASKDTQKVPPIERGAMARLYAEGVPLAEIGRRTNRNRGTVRKVLVEDGVIDA